LDHGTWQVLVHLFPDASIPVVQLSIDAAQPAAFHYELGRKLASLRAEGVLIMGSGNVVHFDFSDQTLNVGQGVSRGEVANALAAQRAAIMGDVRRQVATKGYVG
jgi:aromatic ring-opening dioxygenase catalytic subunit (LigB family)